MSHFLPYGRQVIEDDDIAAVVDVLRGDWLTTGPAVPAFEAALCELTGAPFAIACANGTAALHLALLALDITPGDRVIVPSVTFLATANAVRLADGEVVFADCDPDSGLTEVSHFAEALNRARLTAGGPVKAIMPVHLTGQCGDLAAITEFAKAEGLAVIDDAAHAVGSRYRTAEGDWEPVGSGATAAMTTFSFHPVKNITMGEGGAVTTADPALAERLRHLRSHGMSRDAGRMENAELALDAAGELNPWYYEMPEIGLNYRITDIQCALGLTQLSKLSRFIARRNALIARYDRLLAGFAPLLRPIKRSPGCRSAWHLYPVLIDFAAAGTSRAALMNALRADQIGTQVHYIPVHLQPYYRKRYGAASLPGAERYYERTLSLPLFAGMSDGDVDRVVAALGRSLGSRGASAPRQVSNYAGGGA
jgi:UDP-4-amino-4,6-dideoxy-N-acetyl-beta-L-altrosamine transaminase